MAAIVLFDLALMAFQQPYKSSMTFRAGPLVPRMSLAEFSRRYLDGQSISPQRENIDADDSSDGFALAVTIGLSKNSSSVTISQNFLRLS